MKRLLLFVVCFLLVACEPADDSPPKIVFADLENIVGDAGSGEKIFHQAAQDAPTCASCHRVDNMRTIGPGLQGFGDLAETRVDGQSAEEYTFDSIISPSKFLVPSYGDLMYTQYDEVYEPHDIADLIAFLLTQ